MFDEYAKKLQKLQVDTPKIFKKVAKKTAIKGQLMRHWAIQVHIETTGMQKQLSQHPAHTAF